MSVVSKSKIKIKYLVLLLILYIAVMIYAIFLMFPVSANSEGAIAGSVNYALFSEFIAAYVNGNGFIGSQFMWNIFLFVPMGILLSLTSAGKLHVWRHLSAQHVK